MSKVIYVCYRDKTTKHFVNDDFKIISERITPDNIIAKTPEIKSENDLSYCIVSPSSAVENHGLSVVVGKALAECEWWKPQSVPPEGSYALFRADDRSVELVTDVVGSRTIWFFKSEELFLASTSQRALIMLMNSFDFNREVLPWMLSTGSLGPVHSWDTRINQVPPDSIVSLNRQTWRLETQTHPVNFAPKPISDKEHEKELTEALDETFGKLNLNYNDWVLPLSGGFDSRAILCFFIKVGQGINQLRSITWGSKDSLTIKGNDAYVAHKLAGHLKINHSYFPTDLGTEPLEQILNRYITCGEGRIDHLGGYMDGFKIWKTLFDNQVQGIIRGDEGLGWVPVNTHSNVRARIGISLCTDYSNLKNYEEMGIPKHDLPIDLQRRNQETLEEWRDRLYHQFRIPVVLAALNDLKLSYVEIANPLLFRKIIYKIRQLPDRLRTNKVLFKKIVNSISPDVEYAGSGANPSKKNLLRSVEMVELLKKELAQGAKDSVYTKLFTDYVVGNLKVNQSSTKNTKSSIKTLLALYMPKWLRKGAGSITPKPAIDLNVLAFRMYLTIKMRRVLQDDSQVLKLDKLINEGARKTYNGEYGSK